MTEPKQKGLSIEQATKLLGKSRKTILRWIQRGKLPAHKEEISGHEHWLVDLDGDQAIVHDVSGEPLPHDQAILSQQREIERLVAEVDLLRTQLEAKDKQIGELHILLHQTTQKALTAPQRHWWQFWQRTP